MFFRKLRKQIEDYVKSTEKLACQICLLREDIKNLNSTVGKLNYYNLHIQMDAEKKYKKCTEEKIISMEQGIKISSILREIERLEDRKRKS